MLRGFALAVSLLALALAAGCERAPRTDASIRGQFLQMVVGSPEHRRDALRWIEAHWQPGFTAMAVEALPFVSDPEVRKGLIAHMEKRTGQTFGADRAAWHRWLWQRDMPAHPRYSEVKATLHAMTDPNYRAYFQGLPQSEIQLDEVQWLGVRRTDDLQPLRNPEMIAAADADHLAEQETVYGLHMGGEARAYPERVVAKHGIVSDRVGGTHVLVLHDELTGNATAFEGEVRGEAPNLAVSGFIFRGDTLLYDERTNSLWSSLRGKPLVGELAGRGIRLERVPVAVTGWAHWRRRHPDTKVMADQPAAEGYAAEQLGYRLYVAEDHVQPRAQADRAPSEAEREGMIGIRHAGAAIALTQAFLAAHPVYEITLGGERIVVLTDAGGASRAYLAGDVDIERWRDADTVVDAQGRAWRVTETGLRGPTDRRLERLATQRVQWEAWHGAYPDTAQQP